MNTFSCYYKIFRVRVRQILKKYEISHEMLQKSQTDEKSKCLSLKWCIYLPRKAFSLEDIVFTDETRVLISSSGIVCFFPPNETDFY